MKLEKARKVLLQKVKAVNDLVALGLMEAFTDKPVVIIDPILLKGKSRGYMKAWCQNVLRVWVLTFEPSGKDIAARTLVVKDKLGAVICSYSEVRGLLIGS